MLGILVAAGASFAATALATDNTVYSCTDANGSVSLTNVSTGSNCELLLSYTPPPPAAPAAPAAAEASAGPSAPLATVITNAAPRIQAQAEPRPATAPRDFSRDAEIVDVQVPKMQPTTPLQMRLALRRDAVVQQTRDAYASGQQAPGMNRAVNRRYLMTNRAEYQQANGVTP
jgi:hypothetical protein